MRLMISCLLGLLVACGDKEAEDTAVEAEEEAEEQVEDSAAEEEEGTEGEGEESEESEEEGEE